VVLGAFPDGKVDTGGRVHYFCRELLFLYFASLSGAFGSGGKEGARCERWVLSGLEHAV
jgi:hypothetical protein